MSRYQSVVVKTLQNCNCKFFRFQASSFDKCYMLIEELLRWCQWGLILFKGKSDGPLVFIISLTANWPCTVLPFRGSFVTNITHYETTEEYISPFIVFGMKVLPCVWHFLCYFIKYDIASNLIKLNQPFLTELNMHSNFRKLCEEMYFVEISHNTF